MILTKELPELARRQRISIFRRKCSPEMHQAVMDATGSLSAVREAVQYQGLEERFNADRVERCISSELVCPVRHAEGHCSPWGTDRFTGRLCDIWSAGGTSVDTATNTIGDAEACTQSVGTKPWRIDSLVYVTRVRECASAFQSVPLEYGEDLGALAHRLFQPCRGFQP